MPNETRAEFEKRLAEMGEDEVRVGIRKNRFGLRDSDKNIWATEWLNRQERERNDASSSEQIRIARSAKNAAWTAAIAATIAAIVATISIWISLSS